MMEAPTRAVKSAGHTQNRMRGSVITKNENGGVSSAREMRGVALAEGAVISRLWTATISQRRIFWKHCIVWRKKYDAEMSICRGYDLYEGRPVPDLKQEGIESVTDSEEGLRQVMKARVFGVMPWGKLYRREIFEGVVYPEKTIAEDAYVIVPLMEHCRKVAFSTAQKYYYVHRRESLTTSGFRWSDLGSVEVWDHNQNVVEERHPALQKRSRCALLLGAVFRAGQADAVGNHGRGEKGACEEAGKRA